MFELKVKTSPEWVDRVLSDFDTFLIDHAACERKASSVGLSFVVRYPDRTQMIEPMIQFAREELEHFHQVCRIILKRGICLREDSPDEYVNQLQSHCRFGRDERFLDRLITASIIEARGTERLQLIGTALESHELRSFYERLSRAEAIHKTFFLEMALHYFDKDTVESRLSQLLESEAHILRNLPLRPIVH